ncbi:ATP-binding protein [Streptomyces luteogriseus]|uniref:ATP-binding protein n=1 Tax=Streptomyces luteogriseus TaxID=68233 RepID=UPI00382D2707
MGIDADSEGRRTTPEQHLVRTGYALLGDDSCIAEARRHAVAFLDQAHAVHCVFVSDRARDLTQLVVSELVTNARKYAPGPVLMELLLTARVVEVVVWDSEPTVPEAQPADPGRVGQHGLEIVKVATEELLIEQEPVGKRITARIALSDIPSDTAGRR